MSKNKDTDNKQMNYGPYPQRTLDSMHPDVYYYCYPTVKQMCEMYDNPSNPGLYPYPTQEAVYDLADRIYNSLPSNPPHSMERQYGERILRPLILILLIRELLRRRGSY